MQISEVELIYKSPKIPPSQRKQILNSKDIYKLAISEMFNPDTLEHCENFMVMILNRNNRVLGWKKIGQGGISATVADTKIILQTAILGNASAIILLHNHPSGNTQPSDADVKLTQNIKHAAHYNDIQLLDHVIVTPYGYYSFADEINL